MAGYGRVTLPARAERISWVDSAAERASAGRALGLSFFFTVIGVALAGVLTIAWTPVDDVKFAGLDARLKEAEHNITCLRAARRADYAVIFIGLGSPSQGWQKNRHQLGGGIIGVQPVGKSR